MGTAGFALLLFQRCGGLMEGFTNETVQPIVAQPSGAIQGTKQRTRLIGCRLKR
jgi:hypothetical protein